MLTWPKELPGKGKFCTKGQGKLLCNCIGNKAIMIIHNPRECHKNTQNSQSVVSLKSWIDRWPNFFFGQLPQISITKLQSCCGIYFRSPCISWISYALESNKITVPPPTSREERNHMFRKVIFPKHPFCWYLCLQHDMFIYIYIHSVNIYVQFQ